MSRPKLLIVEDDPGLCAQYRWAFPAYRVTFAGDRQAAARAMQRDRPDAVLLDLGLPPDPEGVEEGLATLGEFRHAHPAMPIVVVTGQGDHAHALRAISLGANDFCEKPAEIALLRTVVDRALRVAALGEENARLAVQSGESPIAGLVTADPGMLTLCRTAQRLAGVAVPVLLLGESGTGKELLARALHAHGPRAAAPFVAINCAAIPETLLESELFGYERGAFTGAVKQTPGRIEAAQGGTLFLDEIGEMPFALQAKLLRFLQDRQVLRIGGRQPVPVDVRIVSATNQPLEEQAEQGVFRSDLLHRLNALTLRIPPLRERGGDTLLLARRFLAAYTRDYARPLRGFAQDAIDAIGAYGWPGNVRELENRVRRAALLAAGPLVGAADLELVEADGAESRSLDLRLVRRRAERDAIEDAMAQAGNVARAARLLGISRPTLYGLLDAHGLSPRGEAEMPDATLHHG